MKIVHAWLLVGLLTISALQAEAQNSSEDMSSVSSCDSLPQSASIEVFGPSDTKLVCREMLRILEGVKINDLQSFEKAAYVLSVDGYEQKQYSQIVKELVDIVRLRGLYNKQARWFPTIDLVVRSYEAFNGVVTPKDVQDFLHSAGPIAKTLSDDGLLKMIILIKYQRQHGDD